MKYERGEFQDEEVVRHSYRSLVIVVAILIGGGLTVAGLYYRSTSNNNADREISYETQAPVNINERKPLDEITRVKIYEEAKRRTDAKPALSQTQLEAVAKQASGVKGNKPLTDAQLRALVIR